MANGQTIGPRAGFKYVSDMGDTYLLVLDQTIGEAGALDPYTVADVGLPSRPSRFKPRCFFAQATISGKVVRKTVPCKATSAAYVGDVVSLDIDGVTFNITGRRGEKSSAGITPAAAPTP